MTIRQKFSTAFAAAALGLCAMPAAAQDAAPAAPATQEAPVFSLRDYVSGDSRAPLYLCGDNTRDCWTPAERDAGDVREYQTTLMAATYLCRLIPGNESLMDDYNRFVVQHRTLLTASYNTVGARLQALSPNRRAGMRAQDTLDTTVANIFSGAASQPGYCGKIMPLIRYSANLTDSAQLAALAREMMASSRPASAAPNPPPAPGV